MARNNPPSPIFVLNPLTAADPSVTDSNTYGEKNVRNEVKKVNIFGLPFISFIAALFSLVNGMALGYPATVKPFIDLHLEFVDEFQQSWFIRIFYVGAVPGALLSGWAMDKYGRRSTIIFGTFSYLIGWALLLCFGDVDTMYAGRLIHGFSFATILPVVGVYISEISPPKIRGILMSFHQLGEHIGFLFVNVSAIFLFWAVTGTAAFAMVILHLIMYPVMIFLPKTPRWLVMANKKESAESTLRLLHGDNVDINIELQEIEESLIDSPNVTPWLDYMKPPLRKYFLICLCLFILQEVSRINMIGLYTVSILNEVKTDWNMNLGTIFLSLLLISGSVLFTFLVEKRERRVFFLLSGMVMAFSLGAMGACIEFANRCFWLQLLALAVASLGYVLGVGPLPYVITCEIFPNRARGRANSMGVATLCLFRFCTTKYLLDFRNDVGDAIQCFVCAGICLVGFIIAYFVIPETKGKTLERIELDLFKQQ